MYTEIVAFPTTTSKAMKDVYIINTRPDITSNKRLFFVFENSRRSGDIFLLFSLSLSLSCPLCGLFSVVCILENEETNSLNLYQLTQAMGMQRTTKFPGSNHFLHKQLHCKMEKEIIYHPSVIPIINLASVRVLYVYGSLTKEEWISVLSRAPELIRIEWVTYSIHLDLFQFLLELQNVHARIRVLGEHEIQRLVLQKQRLVVCNYTEELKQVALLVLAFVPCVEVHYHSAKETEQWYRILHDYPPKRITVVPSTTFIYTPSFLKLCEYARSVWVLPRGYDHRERPLREAYFILDKDAHWISFCPFIKEGWQQRVMRQHNLKRKIIT
jgi:hypothetical protein